MIGSGIPLRMPGGGAAVSSDDCGVHGCRRHAQAAWRGVGQAAWTKEVPWE